FDGSPSAWSQILWRFAGNTFIQMPGEVFFNEFYYPGLLAEIFGGNKLGAPSDMSRKDRRQPKVNVSLTTPVNEADVTTRTVAIKINIKQARADWHQTVDSGVRDV